MQVTMQFEKKSIVAVIVILAISFGIYFAYPHVSNYLERKETERAERQKFKEAERVMLGLVDATDGRMIYIERAMISRETFLDEKERHHPLSNPEVEDYFFFRYRWGNRDSYGTPEGSEIHTLAVYKEPGNDKWKIAQ